MVPIVRPCFDEAEAEAVAAVVRSGWLMQGPQVAAFEAALAAYLEAPHVVAVCNGTVALELTLRALGVGAGDEVITVSHSFIATANSVVAVGATPVFVDIEPAGLCMNHHQAAAAITSRTKAILCVHQLGFACDLPGLQQLADAAGLALIEDAACALGTEAANLNGWQKLGRPHGRAACFSFHPRKVITTGEGGAITTADANLADTLRRLRQHAIPAPLAKPDPFVPDGYAHPAFNARMTDMAAAIGLSQLRKLPAFLAERQAQAESLNAQLATHPVLAPPPVRRFEKPNWQSYPARIRPASKWQAPQVLAHFNAHGISARGGLTNAHHEPAYQSRDNGSWRAQPLPVSEMMRQQIIMLPVFPGMTHEERNQLHAAVAALA